MPFKNRIDDQNLKHDSGNEHICQNRIIYRLKIKYLFPLIKNKK